MTLRCQEARNRWEEAWHQQYLHEVPNGYCPGQGTGVTCPVGVAAAGR